MVGTGGAAADDVVTSSHQLTGMNVSTLEMGIHLLPAAAMVKQHFEPIAADRLSQFTRPESMALTGVSAGAIRSWPTCMRQLWRCFEKRHLEG